MCIILTNPVCEEQYQATSLIFIICLLDEIVVRFVNRITNTEMRTEDHSRRRKTNIFVGNYQGLKYRPSVYENCFTLRFMAPRIYTLKL